MRIVVVTTNRHKAEEIAACLKETAEVTHVCMECPEYRDDDVAVIARKKAEFAFAQLQTPLIVDDTAFYIEALSGFPGPYAAYVHHTLGNPGILKLMEGVKNRNARFVTAIALASAEGIKIFMGTVEGIIVPGRGSQGFGYDPIFEVNGRTLAEYGIAEKNAVSHRGRALAECRDWLKKQKQEPSSLYRQNG